MWGVLIASPSASSERGGVDERLQAEALQNDRDAFLPAVGEVACSVHESGADIEAHPSTCQE